jgi:hypothetical protein
MVTHLAMPAPVAITAFIATPVAPVGFAVKGKLKLK